MIIGSQLWVGEEVREEVKGEAKTCTLPRNVSYKVTCSLNGAHVSPPSSSTMDTAPFSRSSSMGCLDQSRERICALLEDSDQLAVSLEVA